MRPAATREVGTTHLADDDDCADLVEVERALRAPKRAEATARVNMVLCIVMSDVDER